MKKNNEKIILIRGGGDIASGVAYNLYKKEFKIVILEISRPLVVRRGVSFGCAVIEKEKVIEGVKSVLSNKYKDIENILHNGNIPVITGSISNAINFLHPDIVIDATISKRNTGIKKDMAKLTIALGPGFTAGKDVDIVIETNRGKTLGAVIYKGGASPNTGIPGKFMGFDIQRVLRSPCRGRVKHVFDIGNYVQKGDIICYVNEFFVKAPFDGVVRGLIMNGRLVYKGLKIGDVDPRKEKQVCFIISDKAHIIGKSVLKVIKDTI
jgi:xanthine dehydrogenase accessory factor